VGNADIGAPRIAAVVAAGLLTSRQSSWLTRAPPRPEEVILLHDDIINNQFVRCVIRRKIGSLIGRAGLTEQDRPDLEQELHLRLLQGLNHFDPNRGHLNVFITTVIGRAVDSILRKRLAKKRFSGFARSLNQVQDGDSGEPVDARPTHENYVDLANDIDEVLARLPRRLRDLAERLKSLSLSEAARDLDVPRSTLQRWVHRLRQRFEDAGLRIYL
jgi:RNA polymerase sigma-70 factor (ECF subfamily)